MTLGKACITPVPQREPLEGSQGPVAIFIVGLAGKAEKFATRPPSILLGS